MTSQVKGHQVRVGRGGGGEGLGDLFTGMQGNVLVVEGSQITRGFVLTSS